MTTPAPQPTSRPPAPGPLALVQDFINSVDIESGTDELRDAASFEAWLAARDEATGEVAPAELVRARDLRAALRALARTNHDREVDAAALAELNRMATLLPLAAAFVPGPAAELRPLARGVDRYLAKVVAATFVSIEAGTWERLKLCAADSCQWVFFDASKNRSGAWCSMAVCGNRAKVRRFQQRRRSRQGGASDEHHR